MYKKSILLIIFSISLFFVAFSQAPIGGHHFSELYLGPIHIENEKVGILTKTPEFALDVNGTARFTELCTLHGCITDWLGFGNLMSTYVINITEEHVNLNLWDYFVQEGVSLISYQRVLFNIYGVVGSTSTSLPAITIGSWPVETAIIEIHIQPSGIVVGAGGKGNYGPGQMGGDAIHINTEVFLRNEGLIAGGGGAGGGARVCGLLIHGCAAKIYVRGGNGAGFEELQGATLYTGEQIDCPNGEGFTCEVISRGGNLGKIGQFGSGRFNSNIGGEPGKAIRYIHESGIQSIIINTGEIIH
ncbi:MAG: hypothetical protein ACMXYA_00750 [Candidatus Woesearchaeota archaeon]